MTSNGKFFNKKEQNFHALKSRKCSFNKLSINRNKEIGGGGGYTPTCGGGGDISVTAKLTTFFIHFFFIWIPQMIFK